MPRMLITAGPTQEPIDAVRFLGNRSSGRMGVALAEKAAAMGLDVTLLLGPASAQVSDGRVKVRRFRTCEDLRGLLAEETPSADILVMAAAVADYRPKVDPKFFGGKFRRKNENLTLELEPTPDLLAEVSAKRRSDQLFIGFALEPREELMKSAQDKLVRKKVDMVVGNPLETMDSEMIEAMLLHKDGQVERPTGVMPKVQFATWLMERVVEAFEALRRNASRAGT